jgi:hypothetical protein
MYAGFYKPPRTCPNPKSSCVLGDAVMSKVESVVCGSSQIEPASVAMSAVVTSSIVPPPPHPVASSFPLNFPATGGGFGGVVGGFAPPVAPSGPAALLCLACDKPLGRKVDEDGVRFSRRGVGCKCLASCCAECWKRCLHSHVVQGDA